ncbi:hypothetical protein [Candidatus Thiodiazotropha sp. LNASS1]|uniref:hypothetical protein n=1 Tax=Candidatus Thiodiazotropha sp. LNASS1 TaxID=3096260 RepID=UPI0034DF9F77
MAVLDVDITISQDECMKRSKEVMIKVGAKELDIMELEHILSAGAGDYHYFVVCRADKGLAFIGEEGAQYAGGSAFVEQAADALRK